MGSPDCYAKPPGPKSECVNGYTESRDGAGCCFGVDGPLAVSHPLHFGYDEFVATPACAASATSNCGCFFFPSPHNSSACDQGHYHKKGPMYWGGDTDDMKQSGGSVAGSDPYNRCSQYYVGNASAHAGKPALSVEPLTYVTPADDEEFVVDQFESLLQRSAAASPARPFLAVLAFHGALKGGTEGQRDRGRER